MGAFIMSIQHKKSLSKHLRRSKLVNELIQCPNSNINPLFIL